MDLKSIQQRIRAFRDERDWMQFHNPKNLAALHGNSCSYCERSASIPTTIMKPAAHDRRGQRSTTNDT
jgi:hypothetical protein